MNIAAASVLVVAVISRVTPAFGAPAPITLVDVQAEADHGRRLQQTWDNSCEVASDCVGKRAGAQCLYGRCRKEGKDCHKGKPGFDCADGKECVGKKNKKHFDNEKYFVDGFDYESLWDKPEKNWGKCMRLPTMTDITTNYVKHDGKYMHSKGLVNYNVVGGKEGARVKFFNTDINAPGHGRFFFTYDQFARFCVKECSKLEDCTAVSVNDWMYESTMWAWGYNGVPTYSCELLDTSKEVRGVKAAMMGPSLLNATSSNTMTKDEDDVVFIKKGSNVETYAPCDVNPHEMEDSIYCMMSWNSTEDKYPPSLDTYCQSLVGLPSSGPQRDAWNKILPAIVCLNYKTIPCLRCLNYNSDGVNYGPLASSHSDTRNPRAVTTRYTAAESICAPEGYSVADKLVPNAIRDSCKEECYTGVEDCQELLQKATLCSTASQIYTKPEYYGGEINFPYECPLSE